MINIRSLLAGTAIAVLAASALGTPALAKTARLRHHAALSAPDPRDEEIRLLKEQNEMLSQRLSAVEAAVQQTQAAAQQSQAAAQQAQAAVQQAQAAQAKMDDGIKRIPTEVKTAVAALPKPKPGWEANTSISGRMYYDITSISEKSNGATKTPARNGTSFDIKRFYVGIDHKFSNVFSGNVTTDFTYDNSTGGPSATQVYLKKAYLQAKLSDALTIRLGSADLPWVPFVEDTYGYRYVENVLVDRTGFGTSADWGVHALGTFPVGMAKVSYAVAAVNGLGYKKASIGTINRTHTIDVEGRISASAGGFVAAVGGRTGKLGNDVKNGAPTFHSANRFDALLAYSNSRFRVGGEYFYASNWNTVKSVASDNSEGFSAFGSVNVSPKVSVFGRYDWEKPSRQLASAIDDNYFNVGVSYSPVKIVDFALVYKRDKVDNGIMNTSNGPIGGSIDGTYDEVGLWGQFRW